MRAAETGSCVPGATIFTRSFGGRWWPTLSVRDPCERNAGRATADPSGERGGRRLARRLRSPRRRSRDRHVPRPLGQIVLTPTSDLKSSLRRSTTSRPAADAARARAGSHLRTCHRRHRPHPADRRPRQLALHSDDPSADALRPPPRRVPGPSHRLGIRPQRRRPRPRHRDRMRAMSQPLGALDGHASIHSFAQCDRADARPEPPHPALSPWERVYIFLGGRLQGQGGEFG